MKLRPSQLKKFIEAIKVKNLNMGWGMEYFEAVAANAPHPLRAGMMADSEKLMKRCKKARKQTQKAIETLETILKEDELYKSWKGEDRYIEL